MKILMYIVPIVIAVIFIFVFIIIFSPKARGKMMSRQIKSMKYMMDKSKDDIENISTNMANAGKEGVEITTRAIRKGLIEKEGIYCKHCGKNIDKDSKFCKYCGKEQ